MANEYCTVTEVRAIARDPDMDGAALAWLIPTVSRAVDRWCRRKFYTEDEERVYDHVDTTQIRLRDDLVSLNGVADNSGQSFGPSMFTLRPLSGPPYRTLRIKDGSGYSLQWSITPEEAITVDAVWGYRATVPEEVLTGTALWVAGIYTTLDVRGLNSISGDAVNVALAPLLKEPPPDVQIWLNTMRRYRFDGLTSA